MRQQASFPEKAEEVARDANVKCRSIVSANKVMEYGLQLVIKSQLTFLVCTPLEIRIYNFFFYNFLIRRGKYITLLSL